MSERIQDQYLDAIVSGNLERASELREQIDTAMEARQKPKENIESDYSVPLIDQDIKPIEIDKYLTTKFGDEWWDLDMGVIEQKLWQEHAVTMTPQVKEKVWAVKVLCNNQTPFLDWHHFTQIALAMSGVMADFDMLQKPSPGMIIGAIKSMQAIRPQESFSDEVKTYASLLFIDAGIVTPPPSVSGILSNAFEKNVSADTRHEWLRIYTTMGHMMDRKDYSATDDLDNIQARRIILAEMAGDVYA
jgi:hypothetical protein